MTELETMQRAKMYLDKLSSKNCCGREAYCLDIHIHESCAYGTVAKNQDYGMIKSNE